MQSQQLSQFSTTMHQPYATYPIYDPHQRTLTPPMNFYGSGLQHHHSTPESLSPTASATSSSLEDNTNSSSSGDSQRQQQTPPSLSKEEKKRTTAATGPRRNQFTKPQKDALEHKFMAESYVSTRSREEIAKELGLTVKQVKVWYQNRRQKERRRLQSGGGCSKIKKPSTPDHRVIKVPPSADSPDSGIQEIMNETIFHHRQLLQRQKEEAAAAAAAVKKQEVQQQQVIYHNDSVSVSNKVEPETSSSSSAAVPKYDGYKMQQQQQQLQLEDKYTAGAHLYSHYYSSAEYQQALANYYSNEYMQYPGAYHQYYQLISGYQSQQQHQHQQQLYSVDPQETQTYSGY